MDGDAISRSSVDSVSTTGDDYVVVNAEPKLKIGGNGDINDLEQKMSEVLYDGEGRNAHSEQLRAEPPKCMILNSQSMERIIADISSADPAKMIDHPLARPRSKTNEEHVVGDITSPTGRMVKNPFDEKGMFLFLSFGSIGKYFPVLDKCFFCIDTHLGSCILLL
jgi:hypothetical protein